MGRLRELERLLGQALVMRAPGRGVELSPFAAGLLATHRRAHARVQPQLESIAHEIEIALGATLGGAGTALRIAASHDLALARMREALAEHHATVLSLAYCGSSESLARLARGECELAGFHVPDCATRGSLFHLAYRQWLHARRQRLIGFAARTQGLIVAPGNPLALDALAAVAARHARFINRQTGSGTRLLLDLLLKRGGLDAARIAGYGVEETTHLAVAATVAAGAADAGFGIEAAAAAFGLGFVPLARERYFLLCAAEHTETPAVRSICGYLRSVEFAQLLRTLPGYAPDRPGEVFELQAGLPW